MLSGVMDSFLDNTDDSVRPVQATQAQAAAVDATLVAWMRADRALAAQLRDPLGTAGDDDLLQSMRSMGKDRGVRFQQGAALPLPGRVDEDKAGEGGAYADRGLDELLPEMDAVVSEYARWLDQYPAAFLDPSFSAALVAAHEEAAYTHLRQDALLPPSASCP